jgi:hypothetical protein
VMYEYKQGEKEHKEGMEVMRKRKRRKKEGVKYVRDVERSPPDSKSLASLIMGEKVPRCSTMACVAKIHQQIWHLTVKLRKMGQILAWIFRISLLSSI